MHAAPRGPIPQGNNQRHFTREGGSDRRAGKHLASSGVGIGGEGRGGYLHDITDHTCTPLDLKRGCRARMYRGGVCVLSVKLGIVKSVV